MTSPSTTAPSGRPTSPTRSSTTWPRRTDTSAAYRGGADVESDDLSGHVAVSPASLGSGAWPRGHRTAAVKVIDPAKYDLEKVAGAS
jgi:hypothetical protein